MYQCICGNSSEFVEVGYLGNRYYFRCRFCGMQISELKCNLADKPYEE